MAGGGDGVAFFGEDRFESAADIGFVVDDQDVVHRAATLTSGSGSYSCGPAEIGQRNLHNEARAGRSVFLGANGALMLLHDFRRDGKPEAGAARLGGKEWQKEPLAHFLGDAVARCRQ